MHRQGQKKNKKTCWNTLAARRSASADLSSRQQLDSVTQHSHSGTLRMCGVYVCVHVCMCAYVYGDICICVCIYVYMHCLCILLSTGTVPLKCILCKQKMYISFSPDGVLHFYNDPDCFFCPACCGNCKLPCGGTKFLLFYSIFKVTKKSQEPKKSSRFCPKEIRKLEWVNK